MKIKLEEVCETHIDYQVFYRTIRHPFPVPMTPRNVMAALGEMERERILKTNVEAANGSL